MALPPLAGFVLPGRLGRGTARSRRPRSVVVCEGLAIYLETDVLERLIAELARATGPGSLLLVTASTASTDRRARRRPSSSR